MAVATAAAVVAAATADVAEAEAAIESRQSIESEAENACAFLPSVEKQIGTAVESQQGVGQARKQVFWLPERGHDHELEPRFPPG